MTKRQLVENILKEKPTLSDRAIAKKVSCSISYVYLLRKKLASLAPEAASLAPEAASLAPEAASQDPEEVCIYDSEVLDFIEAKFLGFNLGSVVQCIVSDDLRTAVRYLLREMRLRETKS